ncbi:uracil-xanthine permease family protein [Veronia pacifica]|uniref:Uracil permease n=1 Tax=Veronia pacifica TaxID=1080227 RepID=A0A1C3EFZ1_9GAMM|nr:nucleobase:cation symporter-2 family protein [Veronia pacifica]ODA32166.1 uracil permease [Veronia pacifica]
MSDNDSLVDKLRDPDYTPPLSQAIPLGLQHLLAMFVGNITPAIIIAGAAGFGYGSNSPDFHNMIYMLQVSMLFAGVATLFQTIGFGPIGARLPIVQGTSFAFVPILIPIVAGKGVDAMAVVTGGVIAGGLFHAALAPLIGKIRFALPPLVTGLVVTMIGLSLVHVGIQYAAGGVPAEGTAEYGSALNWTVAILVVVVTLGVKFLTKGVTSVAAILIGMLVGYVVAWSFGMVSFANVGKAAYFSIPNPFHFGIDFTVAAIVGFCLMSFISAIETVGDVSGITKAGADREATSEEIRGATYADGLGSALSGVFGALPNTSFSQNVGLIALTGMMSRGVVTICAIFLIVAGFVPKVGALITTIPIEVLGGSIIVMFGMIVAAGISLLTEVNWNRRNMVIFAVSLSIGLGLQQEPGTLQYVNDTVKVFLTSGLLPAAFLAIILNLIIPEEA